MAKKNLDDINLDSIDFNKHRITISRSTKLYRAVYKGADPLTPTGKKSRFATEPLGYTMESYQVAYERGVAVLAGTGTNCFCESLPAAILEAGGSLDDKDVYELIIKLDFDVVDMDSVCKAEGVGKPYITAERKEIWHKFYGRRIKGLRFESSKDYKVYNIVIFPDWFKEFKDYVKIKRINKDKVNLDE